MIRARAGSCRRGLNDVQPAHFVFAFGNAPAGGELTRVAQRSRRAGKEIGIERKNSLGLIEVIDRVDGLAERRDRAGPRVVSVDWFVLMPLCLREL